jgi:hypothetical protein
MSVKIADAITRAKATLEAFRCISNADHVLRIHCVTFGDLRAIVEAAECGPTAAERAAVWKAIKAYTAEMCCHQALGTAKTNCECDALAKQIDAALDALCGKGAM